MTDRSDLINLIKTPVLIALAVTVARATVEAFDAPAVVSMILGVAWLHMLFPIYFAIKILELGLEKPFITLIKTTVMWAVPVRVAVAITYVLAYVYQIDSVRFQTAEPGAGRRRRDTDRRISAAAPVEFRVLMIAAVILAAITGGITLKVKQRSIAKRFA